MHLYTIILCLSMLWGYALSMKPVMLKSFDKWRNENPTMFKNYTLIQNTNSENTLTFSTKIEH